MFVFLQVALSQEDLKVLLQILMENLGEAGSLQNSAPKLEETSVRVKAAESAPAGQQKDYSHMITGRKFDVRGELLWQTTSRWRCKRGLV